MKHFLIASIVAGAIVSAAALGPAAGVAAVRHLPVDHSPAPPLGTVEISNTNPTPAIVPAAQSTPQSNASCTGCPPNTRTTCAGCPPQPGVVQINLVQLPL